MISLIFIFLASICNSIMDTIVHHWKRSKFSLIDKNSFLHNWMRYDSWKLKYVDWEMGDSRRRKWEFLIFKVTIPVQLTDGWHFFKSLMIVAIVLGIVNYESFIFLFNSIFLNQLVEVFICGIVWNLTFNLFYNKLLLK